MPDEKYDVVVIGSGPGGYVAAIRAAQLGMKTACVEKRKTLGGTCLNVGCIPSKALLQSTEHLSWLKHSASEHGILTQNIAVDFKKMMERKEKIVEGLVGGISFLFKNNKVSHIPGTAKFLSQHSLEITNDAEKKTIESKYFILATGSEPISLPFLPFDEKTILSSTGALELQKIPQKLLVIGGGVIGVELASVYNRLGSEVTVVEMLDGICLAMDDAVNKTLLQTLKKQGINFLLKTKVVKAEGKGPLRISLEGGESKEIVVDAVLVAIGRKPYSEGLGLATIGITLNKGFVPVNNNFRTAVPHIFAIGDLIEGVMLAHRASEEGVAVAEIIAGQKPHIDYTTIPNIIYTHPEAASVGLTEKEAKEYKLDITVGLAAFKGNPRARAAGDTDGLVKIIGAGPEKRLIGMHVLGPQASEIIHIGMVAMESRLTIRQLARMPFGHPTLAEAVKEACESFKL